MKFGFLSSGALHLLVILIAWFGLPHIKRDPPKLDALIFVKLSDVSKVTNIPQRQIFNRPNKRRTNLLSKRKCKKQKSLPDKPKKSQISRDNIAPIPEAKVSKKPKPPKIKVRNRH